MGPWTTSFSAATVITEAADAVPPLRSVTAILIVRDAAGVSEVLWYASAWMSASTASGVAFARSNVTTKLAPAGAAARDVPDQIAVMEDERAGDADPAGAQDQQLV